jgi:hypothetical protein
VDSNNLYTSRRFIALKIMGTRNNRYTGNPSQINESKKTYGKGSIRTANVLAELVIQRKSISASCGIFAKKKYVDRSNGGP